ncbi:hypothetical protein KW800_02435 [Candidatus Parcubacteria bacterium]|nr:hypothetical protein [Candidatus Parcubacteria bacterium]
MKLVGSREAIRSPEFHKQKMVMRWLWAIAIVAVILVIFVGPVLLLRSPQVRISQVNIMGNEVTKSEDLETVIYNDLSGYYFTVIPKDSALLYAKTKMKNDLLSAVPRLLSVDVSLANPHSLKVSVTERQPHALYCEIEGVDKCYFLDESGYIFALAPGFSPDVYMTYTTSPALNSPIGTELFKPEDLNSIEQFLSGMKSLGIEPEVLNRSGDEYELTQKLGPVVKWRSAKDLEPILVNLESFIRNSGLKMADIRAMQYIDLRFDNKVFYR